VVKEVLHGPTNLRLLSPQEIYTLALRERHEDRRKSSAVSPRRQGLMPWGLFSLKKVSSQFWSFIFAQSKPYPEMIELVPPGRSRDHFAMGMVERTAGFGWTVHSRRCRPRREDELAAAIQILSADPASRRSFNAPTAPEGCCLMGDRRVGPAWRRQPRDSALRRLGWLRSLVARVNGRSCGVREPCAQEIELDAVIR
jgi:hypothetical protein